MLSLFVNGCDYINTSCMYSRVVTGVPLGEQPSQSERLRKKTSIPGDLNLEQLEDFLVQLYPRVPQLARVGFFLAKATKMKQLVILNCNCVNDIRREVKKGQLFLIPKRDLLPSALVNAFSDFVLCLECIKSGACACTCT